MCSYDIYTFGLAVTHQYKNRTQYTKEQGLASQVGYIMYKEAFVVVPTYVPSFHDENSITNSGLKSFTQQLTTSPNKLFLVRDCTNVYLMLNVSGILQTHFTILHFVTCISCLFEVDVSNERITTYSNRKLFNPVIPGRFCTCWNDGMKAPALSNIPVPFVYMYYNGKHSEGYPIATFVHVLIL